MTYGETVIYIKDQEVKGGFVSYANLPIQMIQEQLKQWRIDRNLDNQPYNVELQVKNILSEVVEYFEAETIEDKIDALCDISVFVYNTVGFFDYDIDLNVRGRDMSSILFNMGYILNDEFIHKLRHYINTIYTSYDMMVDLGYDPDKCMQECFKHINSRRQDPIQKALWDENMINEKWQKDKNQDPSTIYQPQYHKCLL